MPSKKTRTGTPPTIEQLQSALVLLKALCPKFEQLMQSGRIEQVALESLTNRFSAAAIDLVGHNTVQSERYEQWEAFFDPPYNMDDSDQAYDKKIQRAYREGAMRTMTELNSMIEETELKLRHQGVAKPSPASEIQLLLQLCKRLPNSAKVLTRRRSNKVAYEIVDEYDVQDLLQAIIRAYFKYSVSEEPIGKLAGSSSRADFAIEELGVIIEVKYVHGPNEQERIKNQFAEDQQSYSRWQHLQHFIYVVYGADDLKDPESLDELAGARELNGKRFVAYIVRC